VKVYPNPPYSLIFFQLLSEPALKQKFKLKYF